MKKTNMKVSIVVPVYNAEKFLDQCIQSILQQDVGREHIELVLVNDGSKDSSKKICENYATKYPDTVIFIDQENAGVSEARNNGIKAATGDYIGFVDADDYISKNTIRNVIEYFNKPDACEVATVRVFQFGYYNTERPIDKKFNQGTRTIDLNEPEWYDVQVRVAPAFIKSSVAKRHSFNKNITLYEDTRYIAEVLSERMKLGVVCGGAYYNRIHYGDSSASLTTGAAKEKRLYLDSPKNVTLYILKSFRKNKEYPPLFFQYIALYEMRWRIFYNPHNPKDILSQKDFADYENVNREILSLISDQAINNFKMYQLSQRLYLLELKHGIDVAKESKVQEDGLVMWNNLSLFDFDQDMITKINDVFLARDQVRLEGSFSMHSVEGMDIELRIDGDNRSDLITFQDEKDKNWNQFYFDSSAPSGKLFAATIPVLPTAVQSVDFVAVFHGSERLIERFSITDRFRYSAGYRRNYDLGRKIGGFTVYPVTSFLFARGAISVVVYLLQLVKRILRKAISLCILMIKTLR